MSDEQQLAAALALIDDLLRPWLAAAVFERDEQLMLHANFQRQARVHEWKQRRAALTAEEARR